MKWLRDLIKSLLSLLSKNKKLTLGISLALSTALGAVGVNDAVKSKIINKKALKIQEDAIKELNEEYAKTEKVLASLGEIKKEIIESFNDLANVLEKIQNRPEFKWKKIPGFKIKYCELEELITLSTDFQLLMAGISGIGLGAFVGLAAFGIGTLIAAPASIVGGSTVLIKGYNMKKKAIQNEVKAKKIERQANEIVEFYKALRRNVNKFMTCLNSVYTAYQEYLKLTETIVNEKRNWKKFTRKEKVVVENLIRLVTLLKSMCELNIISEEESNNDTIIQKINEEEINEYEMKIGKVLNKVVV